MINFSPLGGIAAYGSRTAQPYSAAFLPDILIPKKPALSEFSVEKQKFDDYLAERDAAYKTQYGDMPRDSVAVAMPVIAGLGTPFVTADQQRLIDIITEKYADGKNLEGLMSELTDYGVDPLSIASSAHWFIRDGGTIVDRQNKPLLGQVYDVLV